MNKYEYFRNGIRYHRISKQLARTLYEFGFTVVWCPVRLCPNSPFGYSVDINKTDCNGSFDRLYNMYCHYNCYLSETGKYPAFYVPDTYAFHLTFTDHSNPYMGHDTPERVPDRIREWLNGGHAVDTMKCDNRISYFLVHND